MEELIKEFLTIGKIYAIDHVEPPWDEKDQQWIKILQIDYKTPWLVVWANPNLLNVEDGEFIFKQNWTKQNAEISISKCCNYKEEFEEILHILVIKTVICPKNTSEYIVLELENWSTGYSFTIKCYLG